MQQLFSCHLHHLQLRVYKIKYCNISYFLVDRKERGLGCSAGWLLGNQFSQSGDCLNCTREFAKELTQCLQKILIIRKHRDAQFYEYVSFHSTSKYDICHICSNGVFFCTERIFSEFGWDKADLKNVIFCLYISRYPSAIY